MNAALDLPLIQSGKVREMYDLGEAILMVASDRISTYDVVHPTPIPDKGKVLTGLSVFWFERTGDIVPNHLISATDGVPGEVRGRALAVKKLEMVPVECVVRNVCAGSMAKRYGIAEGTKLPEPIFEFFLKSDALHDPLVNDDHIRVLGWATAGEIAEMKVLTHKVNAVLKPLFADAGIDLVDYKLEFGHPTDDPGGPLVLGDEFTPDGCRLWDARTGEKMDKDRFRRDLGSVIEHYREVARRIGVPL